MVTPNLSFKWRSNLTPIIYMESVVVGAIIVLVIVLVYMGYRWTGAVLVVGLVAWYGYRAVTYSQSHIGGAILGWQCWNMDKPYGDRCVSYDVSDSTGKRDCETHCLTDSERNPTIANILNFSYNRGIAFPIPKPLLDSLLNDQTPYDAFLTKNIDRHIFFGMRGINGSDQIDDFIGWLFSHLSGSSDYLVEEEVYGIIRPGSQMERLLNVEQILPKYRAEADALLAYSKYHPTQIPLSKLKMFVTDVKPIPKFGNVESLPTIHIITLIVHFGEEGTAHANSIIINHRAKSIVHFEPHVGVSGELFTYNANIVKELISPLRKMGYTYEDVSVVPKGFQAAGEYGDNQLTRGFCATWNIFGMMLVAINPGISLRILLDYYIGLGKDAIKVLSLFAYYISTIIDEYQMNQKTKDDIYGRLDTTSLITKLGELNVGISANSKIIQYPAHYKNIWGYLERMTYVSGKLVDEIDDKIVYHSYYNESVSTTFADMYTFTAAEVFYNRALSVYKHILCNRELKQSAIDVIYSALRTTVLPLETLSHPDDDSDDD